MRFLSWLFRCLWALGGAITCFIALTLCGFTLFFGPRLPQIDDIRDLKLQTPLRIYTADGKLMGEFGETRRQPLRYRELPPLFIQAVLAAEDDRFFAHAGIDIPGLLRAAGELVQSGHIQSGGSTITMQVARNFFLSTEQSFTRKFNEILLSILQLERHLSKEEIFELYANKIFLGNRAYGVQAASYVYYGKSLQELSLAQWAMLAGLPKAPSKYNPLVNPSRALERRNWILGRMLKLGYIDATAHDAAVKEPEVARFHGLQTEIDAPFVAEMARQFAIDHLGENAYTGGYNLYTTIDSHLQIVAQQSTWQGVMAYDRRHGYRGPEERGGIPDEADSTRSWKKRLKNKQAVNTLEPAVIRSVKKLTVEAMLRDTEMISIAWDEKVAAALRPYKSEDYVGPPPSSFEAVFQPGDIIRVSRQEDGRWTIQQIPKAQAALVSLNTDTGAIIALAGGSDFHYSKFNRAIQALRQPGSSFKPFIYAHALEEGYTPATLVNDAPIVFQEAGMQEAWRPENAGDDYLGPIRLRKALYESRNMVSIRILQKLGVKETIASLKRFGFKTENMQPNLSLALGSHAVAPVDIANGYAVLANGGYQVDEYLVSRIEDSDGNIIFEHKPATVCRGCDPETAAQYNAAPRVLDEQTAYIIDDMLKDVIRKGTGRQALELNRPDIAGKTGTTNGPTDAWFSGYSPTIVTTAWLGFDENTYLGKKEYGGTAALPIWISFMKEALATVPVAERPMPTGITTVRIDPDTGLRAAADRQDALFEIFRAEQVPAELPDQGEYGLPDTSGTPASTGSPEASDELF